MNLRDNSDLNWLDGETFRPYVYVREDMKVQNPGSIFSIDWFPWEPLWFNPHAHKDVTYANQILTMEHKAFGAAGLAMPRWVFYDCAIMPGFVAGFACRTDRIPTEIQKALGGKSDREWTPISLFIIIPTMIKGEWFAHNLCSVNSLLPEEHRLYGLGFLTKCFGLWYANIETCCGATQWQSPALKLHTQYGPFELLTCYTPVHTYAKTITYRAKVEPKYWEGFFHGREPDGFEKRFKKTDHFIDPKSEDSMISLQTRLEDHEGPFYLSGAEIRNKNLDEVLNIYKLR